MFPPFPPDYPYGHPLNPYDTGNAVNPLSVFAVQNPIIQMIQAGARTLAPRQTPARPPAGGGGPLPAPTPAPGGPGPGPAPPPAGTIPDVNSTITFDPMQGGGYWSSDPVTGAPVWVDPNAGATIDLGNTVPPADTSAGGPTIDLGYGGGGGGSGDISIMPDLGY